MRLTACSGLSGIATASVGNQRAAEDPEELGLNGEEDPPNREDPEEEEEEEEESDEEKGELSAKATHLEKVLPQALLTARENEIFSW